MRIIQDKVAAAPFLQTWGLKDGISSGFHRTAERDKSYSSRRSRSTGPEFLEHDNDSLSTIVPAVPQFGPVAIHLAPRESLPRKVAAPNGTHSSWKRPLPRLAERHSRNARAEQKAGNQGYFGTIESSASTDSDQRTDCRARPLFAWFR